MEISERPPFSKKKCVNLMTLMQKQQPIFFFLGVFLVIFLLKTEELRNTKHKADALSERSGICSDHFNDSVLKDEVSLVGVWYEMGSTDLDGWRSQSLATASFWL